jgi:hypothetical protein
MCPLSVKAGQSNVRYVPWRTFNKLVTRTGSSGHGVLARARKLLPQGCGLLGMNRKLGRSLAPNGNQG